jgi:hypothetical protein
MDLHLRAVAQGGEGGNGDKLPGAMIQAGPRPDLAQRVVGNCIGEERLREPVAAGRD